MRRKPNIQVIAQSWCLKNKIIIYAVPVNNTTLRIVIKYKDKKPLVGEKIYQSKGGKDKDEKWWEAIAHLYVTYYEREN